MVAPGTEVRCGYSGEVGKVSHTEDDDRIWIVWPPSQRDPRYSASGLFRHQFDVIDWPQQMRLAE